MGKWELKLTLVRMWDDVGNEELMDISVEVLKRKRIELPYDKVPPLGTYPKGSMSYQSVTCIAIFTATLFQ